MKLQLITTATALFLLGAGSALAQSSNNVETQDPTDPNCTSAATAGCPNNPDDVNTQSGPGTTGQDSQPSTGDAPVDGTPANNDGDANGDPGAGSDAGANGGAAN